MGDDFVVSQHGEADVDIIDTPWQSIKLVIEEACQRARIREAGTRRGYLKGLEEIDNVSLMSSIQKRSEEDARILIHCCTSAAWSNAHNAAIGLAKNEFCHMCGGRDDDIQHIIWECPIVQNHPDHKCKLQILTTMTSPSTFGMVSPA